VLANFLAWAAINETAGTYLKRKQERPMGQQSQCNQILAYLKQGNAITFLEAFERFGCMHLPRRILDLKEAGHSIDKTTVTTDTGKRIARYFLAGVN
jgi:hypothetical protein